MTTDVSKSGMMLGRAGTSERLSVAFWVIKLVGLRFQEKDIGKDGGKDYIVL
jgi:hypothetical protein